MEDQAFGGGILVLEVPESRLDATYAPAFRAWVGGEIEQGNRRIVLNLALVQFIDSTGIGTLVGLLKRAGGRGDLALANLSPAVEKAFRLTRMDKVFAVFPDVAGAVTFLDGQ